MKTLFTIAATALCAAAFAQPAPQVIPLWANGAARLREP